MTYKKIDSCRNEFKNEDTSDIEEEWIYLKTSMLEGIKEVCGVRKLANGRNRREVYGGIYSISKRFVIVYYLVNKYRITEKLNGSCSK